jgi:hypothetical protein
MLRLAVLLAYLLSACGACAGQATGQFQVGITITGKRASPAPGSSNGPSGPISATTGASSPAAAARLKRIRQCDWIRRTYGLAAHAYIDRDGKIHRCP